MAKVSVKQKPGEEIAVDVLAEEIVKISEGVKQLRSGRLKDKTLYLLIQHAAGGSYPNYQKVPIQIIKAVLDGAESLAKEYVK